MLKYLNLLLVTFYRRRNFLYEEIFEISKIQMLCRKNHLQLPTLLLHKRKEQNGEYYSRWLLGFNIMKRMYGI